MHSHLCVRGRAHACVMVRSSRLACAMQRCVQRGNQKWYLRRPSGWSIIAQQPMTVAALCTHSYMRAHTRVPTSVPHQGQMSAWYSFEKGCRTTSHQDRASLQDWRATAQAGIATLTPTLKGTAALILILILILVETVSQPYRCNLGRVETVFAQGGAAARRTVEDRTHNCDYNAAA